MRQLSELGNYLAERRRALGRWTRGQVNTLLAFGLAIALWTAPAFIALISGPESENVKQYNRLMPEGIAALLGASLLFVLPVHWKERRFTLTWDQAARIDWGTILLFGSGIALGDLAFSTRLADALGNFVVQVTGLSSSSGLTLISAFLGIFVSETTSNTSAANMVVPASIAVAQNAGINSVPPAVAACLGASYGFMLPVSTPPNAMVYGTGMVPITRMAKTGFLFDIVGLMVIWIGLRLLLG